VAKGPRNIFKSNGLGSDGHGRTEGATGLKHLIYLSGSKRPSKLRRVRCTIDVAAYEADGSDFLRRSEVSTLLGVSPNTVTRWAREGRLPCQITLGGHHRFDRELVERLRKSLFREAAVPARMLRTSCR
jgi:excisionase family DNA binding protein